MVSRDVGGGAHRFLRDCDKAPYGVCVPMPWKPEHARHSAIKGHVCYWCGRRFTIRQEMEDKDGPGVRTKQSGATRAISSGGDDSQGSPSRRRRTPSDIPPPVPIIVDRYVRVDERTEEKPADRGDEVPVLRPPKKATRKKKRPTAVESFRPGLSFDSVAFCRVCNERMTRQELPEHMLRKHNVRSANG